jgi:hypothetical protein
VKDLEAKPTDLANALQLAKERSVSLKVSEQTRKYEEQAAKQFQAELEDLQKHPEKLTDEIELLKAKIERLKVEELKIEAVSSMASVMALAPPKPAPVSKVSILPIWKKFLELYQKKVGGDAFQELKPENMVLDDYCFAGPRKVGPWFGSLGEVKGKDACKVMVFGLEICADHAAFRIKTINSGPDPVAIDIQLVPSAGMRPTYFAARKGGYLFNCDGWSKPILEGGKNLTVHFDGPSPCKKDGTPFTPGSPHTGLVKMRMPCSVSPRLAWFQPHTPSMRALPRSSSNPAKASCTYIRCRICRSSRPGQNSRLIFRAAVVLST